MMPHPISEATPVHFAGPLPAACDVVVIGGGVIGVMSAWFLAEKGLRVTLCEKGRIAGEQSSRNWGWVRQQGRDPAELPIMIEAMRIWKSLAQELGEGLGFRQEGALYLAKTEAEMAGFADWLPHAQANGLDTMMQSKAQVSARLKGAADVWCGGLITPSDGRAEPWVAVPMLAGGAVARGAVIVENCAVRTLDIVAGRIAGVVTEVGRIACSHVVLAGGAWSRLFATAHGVTFPQLLVAGSVAATEPMPDVFAGNATDDKFAFRRRADGSYTIAPGMEHDFYIGPNAFRSAFSYLPTLMKDFRSTNFRAAAPTGFPDAWGTKRHWAADEVTPFEKMRVLNPKPNLKTIARVQDSFAKAFPSLGRPKLRSVWAGMIDTMPDIVPVIDHAAAIPGLVIATGMSGHGFGIGPGVGRVVSDLVMGNDPGHDLSRFRLSRFSDGSKIAPGPSL
jgi:glycine/D-amino acid oxidase-like deaminating enzyme